jgi:hypothetical protein
VRFICKDCCTIFATRPPLDCLACGSGNISVQEESATERPSEAPDEEYTNKILRHLLGKLIEKTYSGPCTEEFWDTEIERTIERMRPYLKEAN